jgi:hypothetical protein
MTESGLRERGDVIDENVVQRSLSHRDFPCAFATHHSSCEFGFCRKGFAPRPEIQLAVGQQPVYNPALRCFR